MNADAIFAGPIVRRAQQNLVAIWLATTERFTLEAVVRPVGSQDWTGASTHLTVFGVHPKLFVYLFLVVPTKTVFPTERLLEYSIGVIDEAGEVDHAPFKTIVDEDGLAYEGFDLPTFYLQKPGRKLSALYVSCRKVHDDHGGVEDALPFGDDLIARDPADLSMRPAILCMTGDQIYADDVHDLVFDEVVRVANAISGNVQETLPKGMTLPGGGQRAGFVERNAGFTANHKILPGGGELARNHLVTHAEYAAMYGLAWCRRNWLSRTYPNEIQGYVDGLRRVRRLLANTPTYMIFDDHDVTDDWNLSLKWRDDVWKLLLGRRIVANALSNFWLFQAWGNDPGQYQELIPDLIEIYDLRQDNLRKFPNPLDVFFWSLQRWEFHTPTYPFIYFLNTRTQRGFKTGFRPSDGGPPAYLKSPEAWSATLQRLMKLRAMISREDPLVLVVPAPVFGFDLIDLFQQGISSVVGPYRLDLEGWAANHEHLMMFLHLCGDLDVVLISGDVHYGFTSTATFSVFDSTWMRSMVAKFPNWAWPKKGAGTSPTYQFLYASTHLQLTSSAAKNFAKVALQTLSSLPVGYSYFVNAKGKIETGMYKNGELRIRKASLLDDAPVLEAVALDDYKPICAYTQRYNDAFNSPYLSGHNIGLVAIDKRRVENSFLTKAGKTSTRTWSFANPAYWGEATP